MFPIEFSLREIKTGRRGKLLTYRKVSRSSILRVPHRVSSFFTFENLTVTFVRKKWRRITATNVGCLHNGIRQTAAVTWSLQFPRVLLFPIQAIKGPLNYNTNPFYYRRCLTLFLFIFLRPYHIRRRKLAWMIQVKSLLGFIQEACSKRK